MVCGTRTADPRRCRNCEEWAKGFADPNASSECVDVLYRGLLAKRAVAAYVDGGHCLLPWPSAPEGVLTVAGDYVQLIRLVDSLCRHESEFERYFRRADLHEVTAQIPWLNM